jgi:hypothetical protein
MMRLLLVLFLLSPVAMAQTSEPDLSKYGSLARQQIVRENLRLRQETQEIHLREYERRQRPPPEPIIIYSTYRYSDTHYDYPRRDCSERYYRRDSARIGSCRR